MRSHVRTYGEKTDVLYKGERGEIEMGFSAYSIIFPPFFSSVYVRINQQQQEMKRKAGVITDFYGL